MAFFYLNVWCSCQSTLWEKVFHVSVSLVMENAPVVMLALKRSLFGNWALCFLPTGEVLCLACRHSAITGPGKLEKPLCLFLGEARLT